ncbi:MAG: M23 family metallopeptidase [Clostridia bacterium]|nr:M23 family metallopeptidase [Clostridia bacterium]
MDINKKKKKKKNKIARAIVCSLIMIPTIIAIVTIFTLYTGKLNSRSVTEIMITSPDGNEYCYSDDDSLNFFSKLYNSAYEIETPAHNLKEYKTFILRISRPTDDITCNLLLTDSPEDCLISFSQGENLIYKNIVPEHASVILTDPNFSSAYTYSKPSKLTVTANQTNQIVLPVQMEWSYRRSDENFYVSDTSDFICQTPPNLEYKPENQYISLSFELAPDILSVQILDGENTVFSDKYDSLNYRNFVYNKKADLKYIFTAEWIETSSSKYHGKAIYQLDVKYIVEPTAVISTSKITVGDFMVYTVFNTADSDVLTVQDEDLKIYPHSDTRIVFYPSYPGGFVGQKNLIVNINEDSSVKEFIEIALPAETADTYTLDDTQKKELFVADYSRSSSVMSTLRQYTLTQSGKLWEGKFDLPLSDMKETLSYGTEIISDNEPSGKSSFMLLTSSSDDVKAIGNGVITFSGEIPPFGKTIIIDHGLGIASFYSNLNELCFPVGETVTKGLTIAKINSVNTPLQYGVSVNGYFVNPNSLNDCLELSLLV